ncbi:MAG: threonine/serine exporter family protein [Alkaliphilus sp.]
MILSFTYAFLSTIGFSVLFNIPRREIVLAGICGGLGWLVHDSLSLLGVSVVFSSFIGALVVSVLAEILAKLRKKPATIFVVPGIIPLVPGYALYFSMLKIIEENYVEASKVGFEALIVSVMIASAIIIATSFGRLLKRK